MAYDRIVRFEWDPAKNRANVRKHGISFDEAVELFTLRDDLVLEVYDFEHSHDEDRIVSIGPIRRGTIVVVSVEGSKGETIRLLVRDLQLLWRSIDIVRSSGETHND